MRTSNLIGRRFGRLVVLEDHGRSKNQSVIWKCKCDCGNFTTVVTWNLRSHRTQSCGCFNKERTKQTHIQRTLGKRFERLTVVSVYGRDKHGSIIWNCLCDCGKTRTTTTNHLRSGDAKSCGCLMLEQSSKQAKRNNTLRRNRLRTQTSKSGAAFLDMIEKMFNIKIIREYRCGERCFDGKFGKLLFEIDGKFWHQLHQDVDHLKDNIALRHGYSIVRIEVNSTREVKRRFQENKDSIKKAIRLVKPSVT